METRILYVEDVKKAIAVIRREVRNAENALTMIGRAGVPERA
jgi:hypothetical protein